MQTGLRQRRLALPARPLRRHPGHRAPRGPRRHRGALPRPAAGQRLGARRQHGSARGCRCTRPASARCCSPTRRRRCSRGARPPDAASRRTPSPSPACCGASCAGCCATATRPPEEMSLGACSVGGPRPAGRRGRRRARHRRPHPPHDRPRLVAALQVAAHGIGRSLTAAGDRTPTRPGAPTAVPLSGSGAVVAVSAGRHARRHATSDPHPRRHRRRRPRRPDALPPARAAPASTRWSSTLRTRREIEQTHRAGILEQDSVRLLVETGRLRPGAARRLPPRGHRAGLRRRRPPHRLRGAGRTRPRQLYPQTDVFIDLADARERDGGDVRFGVTDVVGRTTSPATSRACGSPTPTGWRTSCAATTRRRRRLAQRLPRRGAGGRAAAVLPGVPLRLVRHPVRGPAQRAGADLQPLRPRLRADQPAHRRRSSGCTSSATRTRTSPTGRDDRIWEELQTRRRRQRLHPARGADHLQDRAALPQLRAGADAARPPAARRRRGAHRPADRREGPQPGARRRAGARRGARARAGQARPRCSTPTASARWPGCGRRSTSPTG